MKILIKIKYDGSAFNGFQFQPGLPTVQGTLTDCASSLFGFQCNVTGCSRTDAGVHALGYCACVEPASDVRKASDWCKIPAEKVHRAFNSKLPPSVSVTGAAFVPDLFHPRYDAVSKEYIYKIYDGLAMDPFLVKYVCPVKRKITDESLDLMNAASSYIIGEHDFKAFMAAGSSVKNTVREVYLLKAERLSENTVQIRISANGFLYNMVRIISGTLLEIGYGKMSPDCAEKILTSADRRLAGPTAPPDGLYLNDVRYNRKITWCAV